MADIKTALRMEAEAMQKMKEQLIRGL